MRIGGGDRGSDLALYHQDLSAALALLQAGITSVRKGHLVPIQVSRTGDEIEYLGASFNRMIEALAQSHDEIRQHQELLEERIHQRTEDLERAMHGALNASQAKSEFLANMSHELRTPMNGLLGMLDLALDGGINGEQKDQLETAQRCAYSLLALLNDILDLSKIEAGKMLLERFLSKRVPWLRIASNPRQPNACRRKSNCISTPRPDPRSAYWETLCASARSWPTCCRTPSNLRNAVVFA